MKWALLSVWEKSGIIELATVLHEQSVSIMSSGGTGKALSLAGIPFTEISGYTGYPEMMDGRVKTLHPRVHGGLLGRRNIDDQVMQTHGIHPIDILVVNLYPFEEMAGKHLPHDQLIEYIDVGGPAMIRAAAKNYRDVAVIVDPADYPMAEQAIRTGAFTDAERLTLAKKAFSCTAAYDAVISNYLNTEGKEFPEVYTVQFRNGRPLRYGENPHQTAEIYGTTGIASAEPLQGKQMSYNNYLDLSAASGLLAEFEEPCAVIVKHNNPCGVAVAGTIMEAYQNARDTDPVSAYGSVVALNRPVDEQLAKEFCATFVEVLCSPKFSPEARELLKTKENMRVIALPEPVVQDEIRTIAGGVLVQRTPPYQEHWRTVSDRDPSADEMSALNFAWKVVRHTRSNAIIFAGEGKTLGIGAGQMSRVDAARIAIDKARYPLKDSAVASDAFLPFPDTLEVAVKAGATALVQPGGSIRDSEVIDAANQHNIAMIFTGIRYFRH